MHICVLNLPLDLDLLEFTTLYIYALLRYSASLLLSVLRVLFCSLLHQYLISADFLSNSLSRPLPSVPVFVADFNRNSSLLGSSAAYQLPADDVVNGGA